MQRTNIRQRQIYWLDDCDPLDGVDEKDRPVIIIETPDVLRHADMVEIVACSTHPRRQDKPRFKVPSRHTEPDTGLPDDCWALPRWYLKINRHRLKTLKGNCPLAIFEDIFEAVLDEKDKKLKQ